MALPFPIKPPTITHSFILESNFPVLQGEVSKKKAATYLEKAVQLVDRRLEFVEKQILAEQAAHNCPFKKQTSSQTSLKWTAKKTDLIELLYALDVAGCFNSGNVSLNQIAVYLENVFSVNLSHFSRDFYEMRIRNNQTPFIDRLKTLLKKRMDNPKSPYG